MIAKTIQSSKVLDILNSGKTYYASYNNIFNKEYIEHYKNLASMLGFKECPIFAVPNKKDSAIESSNIYLGNGNVMLILNIPTKDVHITDYYSWSDYLYYYKNEYEDGDLDWIINDLSSNKKLSDTDYPQIVINRIEPSWVIEVIDYDIEEGTMKKEAILSKEFLNNVLTEKDYDVINLLNAWTKFVKGAHSGNFYAGGQVVMYYNLDDELPQLLRPYINSDDYKKMVEMARKKYSAKDKEVEVYLTLKEVEDILKNAGISYMKKESIEEAISEEELEASLENGIGLNLLGREEKTSDEKEVFETDEAYDIYIDIFIMNNMKEENPEDEEFEEGIDEYVSCVWDLFNHFLKNGQSEESIESFDQADDLSGFQIELAGDVYNAYRARVNGEDDSKFFNHTNESLLIESAIRKPRLKEGDLDILQMLKSHGYHYLVRNSKGILLAYHKEPYKIKGGDWAADQSMPYELSMQNLFPFVKYNNRKAWNIDTLLQKDELQADTMLEPEEMVESVRDKEYERAFSDELLSYIKRVWNNPKYKNFFDRSFIEEEYRYDTADKDFWFWIGNLYITYKDFDKFGKEMIEADFIKDLKDYLESKGITCDIILNDFFGDGAGHHGNGYAIYKMFNIQKDALAETTQASAVGSKVSYPQKKNRRIKRGKR